MTSEIDSWRSQWAEAASAEADRPWRLGELFSAGRQFVKETENPKATYREVWKLMPKLGACAIEFRTLREYAQVADAFEPEDRNPRVSWSHHRELWAVGAWVPKHPKYKQWLERVEKDGMSVADLRAELAGKTRKAPPPNPISFVARRWADQGVAGFHELFPLGEPINKALALTVEQELSGLFDEFRRVGLI